MQILIAIIGIVIGIVIVLAIWSVVSFVVDYFFDAIGLSYETLGMGEYQHKLYMLEKYEVSSHQTLRKHPFDQNNKIWADFTCRDLVGIADYKKNEV